MAVTVLQHSNINNAEAFLGMNTAPVDFALLGDNVVIEGIEGKRIYVFRLKWVVDGDTILTVKDGTSTDLTGPMTYFAGGTDVFDTSNIPWFQTSEGNDFILSSTQMTQVSGVISYQQY